MKNLNSSLRERLKTFIKYSRMTQDAFAVSLGLSRNYVNAIRKGIGKDVLDKILTNFPDLNRDWLLYGEGEMLKSMPTGTAINNGTNNGNIVGYNNGTIRYHECEEVRDASVIAKAKRWTLPYIKNEIVQCRNCNIKEMVSTTAEDLPKKDVVELVGHVDYLQRVITTAMMPLFQPGDFLFIRFLPDDANIISGAIYLIDTKVYGAMVRQVYVNGDNFNLHSINTDYDELIVNREDVYSISIVVCSLRSDFNCPSTYVNINDILSAKNDQIDKMIASQDKLIAEITEQNRRLEQERVRQDKLVNLLIGKLAD